MEKYLTLFISGLQIKWFHEASPGITINVILDVIMAHFMSQIKMQLKRRIKE